MAACMILLRCIHRQAASGNGAGRSGNWKARSPYFVGWGNWKARSPNFVGSPMCTVSNRSPMSTVSSAAPWLMLPPSFEDGGKMSYNLYSPVDKKVTRLSNRRSSIGEEVRLESAVLVGSSHGWLALCKGESDFDLFLYNPISDRQIKLPPVETIPVLEERFRYRWGRPDRVILSCPPPNEEEEESMEEDSNSCRAVLSYGGIGYMAVCCPGLSTEWTPFGAPFHEDEELNEMSGEARIIRSYEDFVYSTRRKQLFCVTQYSDLEAWDIGDPRCPKLNWKESDDDMDYDEENYPWHARCEEEAVVKESSAQFTYLVYSEHSDRLFLVQRYFVDDPPYETVGFDVHEIIIKQGGGGELRYMDGSLNGMAFFVGSDAHGLVVESPGTMNLLPNSIYYADQNEVRTPSYWNKCGGHHLVIFDYANQTFSPCHHLPGFDIPPKLDMSEHKFVPTPMWFTPSPSIRSLEY